MVMATNVRMMKNENQKSEHPLDALSSLLGDDLTQVNAMILRNMQSDVPLIPQLAAYLIAAGGETHPPPCSPSPVRGFTATAARALLALRHRLSSFTPLHCCTTMSLTKASNAGGNHPPMSSSEIRPVCWSAISCFPARFS